MTKPKPDDQKERQPKLRADGMVRCSKCGGHHPPSAFSRFPNGRFVAWCKPCMAEYVRGYRRQAKAAAA